MKFEKTFYGHPQGPTAMRLVIELIEELVDRGGGYGLSRAAPPAMPARPWW